jgi:hypothetical protein
MRGVSFAGLQPTDGPPWANKTSTLGPPFAESNSRQEHLVARVMILPSGKSDLNYIFATDYSVGAGGANRRDDVLLVQFFLAALSSDLLRSGSTFFNYKNKEGVPFNYTVPIQPQIAIDGFCGGTTIAYIRHFQKEASKTYGSGDVLSIINDGVITPTRKGEPWGVRSGHVLSIVRLNTEYRNMFGAARLMTINTDPLFPRELLPLFFMN